MQRLKESFPVPDAGVAVNTTKLGSLLNVHFAWIYFCSQRPELRKKYDMKPITKREGDMSDEAYECLVPLLEKFSQLDNDRYKDSWLIIRATSSQDQEVILRRYLPEEVHSGDDCIYHFETILMDYDKAGQSWREFSAICHKNGMQAYGNALPSDNTIIVRICCSHHDFDGPPVNSVVLFKAHVL